MPDAPVSRACTKCGVEKSLSEFSPHKRGKYGRQPRCKECCTKANVDRYWSDHARYKEKARVRALADQQKNREKRNASRRAWVARNPEKMKAARDAWVAKHAEQHRVTKLAWHVANRAKCRKHTQDYREREDSAPGECSAESLHARIAFFGGKCWVPGCSAPYEAVDHVIPLSRGGTNWPANLRPICWEHNSRKGAKMPRKFLEELCPQE